MLLKVKILYLDKLDILRYLRFWMCGYQMYMKMTFDAYLADA